MLGIRSLLPAIQRRPWAWLLVALGVPLAGWSAGHSPYHRTLGAAQPYQPCPGAGAPCRILPLGDSLTWGIGYEGGYRVALFELALAAGKKITFTGSQRNGPIMAAGSAFPRRNEGHNGWRIDTILTTVPRPALNDLPHIVLLHAGTNDVYAHETPPVMADRLEALIDRLEQAAPKALIAVAEILPMTDPALRDQIASYNSELRGRVQTRISRGEHLMLVDQFSHFQVSLLVDGVHPTRLGYEQMANVWYTSIAPYLR